jgi:hypothetical protein
VVEKLTWRNESTPILKDYIGYDGERAVARIIHTPGTSDWTWSVFVIAPAVPGLTNGPETDPKVARRKVEEIWARAKAEGVPHGNHIKL